MEDVTHIDLASDFSMTQAVQQNSWQEKAFWMQRSVFKLLKREEEWQKETELAQAVTVQQIL